MKDFLFAPGTILKIVGGFLASVWLACGILLQTLLILMGLDVLTGLLAACIEQKVSSVVSFRGMARKGIIVCVVAASHAFSRGLGQAYGVDFDLGTWVAGGFCIHELFSIVENTGRAGVHLPKPLIDALEKLKAKGSASGKVVP